MERMSPHRATLLVTGLFVVGLLLGAQAGRAAVRRATHPYADLERFARVLSAIRADYVEPVDGDLLVEGALAGMVDRLDPHSRWMRADAVAALDADADGSSTGFGLEVGRAPDGVVVLKVLPGSPAAREGLVRGDRILRIDGTPLAGMDIDGVRTLFDGDLGQRAELEVLRVGAEAPQTLRALRDAVRLPATETALLDGDLMYVRVVDFQRQGAAELEAEVRAMQGQAARPWAGMILDLRDNTGGLLDEAVAVADLFLDQGPIVQVEGRRAGLTTHRATPGGFPPELPVVVVVNGLSASASEIVAGALREAGRAALVGSRTYGKGSVQQLYRHPDGSALKLTVARYLLPSGTPISAREGLIPDHPVAPLQPNTPRARLQARIEALPLDAPERADLLALVQALAEPDPSPSRVRWTDPPADRVARDPVLQRAIAVLGR